MRAALLMSLASHTLAASVVVQTRIVPEADIRAGQQIQYEVDVLTDTWLTGTPDFPALQIPGALLSFEGSQGRSIQRTINGKRYFGVTYSYRLIPLQPGVMTLPAFGIEAPVGQADAPVGARVPEQTFAVQALPAAESAHITLLAGDVQLSQNVSPAGNTRQAGEPLIREIRVQAQNAMALSIPPLLHPDTSELTGQTLPPEVAPITDRRGNTVGGERIERVRYVPERAGSYQLPELTLYWWDIDEGRTKQSTLPALEIEVVASVPSGPSDLKWPWLLLLPASGIAVWLLTRVRNRLVAGLRAAKIRVQKRWQRSLAGARSQAIRQLKGQPRELTGLYRLIERQGTVHSLRNSPLSPLLQDQLLSGISGYYSCHPEPDESTRTLVRLIRKLK